MSLDSVNKLNILLVFVSCLLAYIAPFELFAFSYIVLGPLHYVTEINWLRTRNYFVASQRAGCWFWGLALLFSIAVWLKQATLMAAISFVAMVLATDSVLNLCGRKRLLFLLSFCAITGGIGACSFTKFFFGLYLSTVIHVFLFTLIFMWSGVRRAKQAKLSGYLSILSVVFSSACLLLLMPGGQYSPHSYFLMVARGFGNLECNLADLFGWPRDWSHYVVAMRFIAFAYTYHYLNWFSKTGLIGWHRIGKRKLLALSLIYVCSLILYIYDFGLGLRFLMLLSIGHVYLELPLNVKTLLGFFSHPSFVQNQAAPSRMPAVALSSHG